MSTAKMRADSTSTGDLGRSKKRKKVEESRHCKKPRKSARKGKEKSEVTAEENKDLDLDVPLHPISSYLKERSEMIEQLFHCVSGASLRRSLPDVLKDMRVEDLKARCLQQLEVMSRKRIRRILEGDDPMEISSSGTEDESDGDGVEKKGKCRQDSLSERDESGEGLNTSEPPTQMEILELEMRARAIKAMLKSQHSDGGESSGESPERENEPGKDREDEDAVEKGSMDQHDTEQGDRMDAEEVGIEQDERSNVDQGDDTYEENRDMEDSHLENAGEFYGNLREDSYEEHKVEVHGEIKGSRYSGRMIDEEVKETTVEKIKRVKRYVPVSSEGFTLKGRRNKSLRGRRPNSESESVNEDTPIDAAMQEEHAAVVYVSYENDKSMVVVVSDEEMIREQRVDKVKKKEKIAVKKQGDSDSSMEEGEIKDDSESEWEESDEEEGMICKVVGEVLMEIVNEVVEMRRKQDVSETMEINEVLEAVVNDTNLVLDEILNDVEISVSIDVSAEDKDVDESAASMRVGSARFASFSVQNAVSGVPANPCNEFNETDQDIATQSRVEGDIVMTATAVETCLVDSSLGDIVEQGKVWMDSESESDEDTEDEDDVVKETGNSSDGSGSSFFDEVENRDTSVYVDVIENDMSDIQVTGPGHGSAGVELSNKRDAVVMDTEKNMSDDEGIQDVPDSLCASESGSFIQDRVTNMSEITSSGSSQSCVIDVSPCVYSFSENIAKSEEEEEVVDEDTTAARCSVRAQTKETRCNERCHEVSDYDSETTTLCDDMSEWAGQRGCIENSECTTELEVKTVESGENEEIANLVTCASGFNKSSDHDKEERIKSIGSGIEMKITHNPVPTDTSDSADGVECSEKAFEGGAVHQNSRDSNEYRLTRELGEKGTEKAAVGRSTSPGVVPYALSDSGGTRNQLSVTCMEQEPDVYAREDVGQMSARRAVGKGQTSSIDAITANTPSHADRVARENVSVVEEVGVIELDEECNDRTLYSGTDSSSDSDSVSSD